MYKGLRVAAVIPAFNEEKAIGKVVSELSRAGEGTGTAWVDTIVVCSNGSTDTTAEAAAAAGAKVVEQATAGYGIACLTAIDALPPCDIVLFIDGDDSCYPAQAEALLSAITEGADLVIGSRRLGRSEPGALTLPQRLGNRLAIMLIRIMWQVRVTDLGPFRAIRKDALDKIEMKDRDYGWTVEMQIKAIQHGLCTAERAVDSKVRIGKSKISGTVKGVIGAGFGIIRKILSLRLAEKSSVAAAKY